MKKSPLSLSKEAWIGMANEDAEGVWHWTLWRLASGFGSAKDGAMIWLEDALCEKEEPSLEEAWFESWEDGEGIALMTGAVAPRKNGENALAIGKAIEDMGLKAARVAGGRTERGGRLSVAIEFAVKST